MFFRILFLLVALNVVLSSAILSDKFEVDPANSGNAPFFELPCMVIGGTCARSIACPRGTKVGAKGLCPVQQAIGMECCRPSNVHVKFKLKVPFTKQFQMSTTATDCARDQICCV